jgi:hydroxymethylbilane synthase
LARETAQVCIDSSGARRAGQAFGCRLAVTRSEPIRIGTRGSALAIAQAQLVVDLLSAEGVETSLEIIASDGDRDKSTPLTALGGKGIFASSLQQALHEHRIDLAVHSAKDLPTVRPHGLTIGAVLNRDDPRDVQISRHGVCLADLPANPRIGTSSRRRMAQVLHARPDALAVDLRGNIDSRVRKALETDLDGIVIAAAGLHRLGWHERITEYLDPVLFVPAPGQAALAVEVRSADERLNELVGRIDEPDVRLAIDVERAFLAELGAGCSLPVGAHARTLADGSIELFAMLADESALNPAWRHERLHRATAVEHARSLARELKGNSAGYSSGGSEDLNASQPLLGRTVLITRDVRENDPLAVEIRLRGGVPVISPALTIRTREPNAAEREVLCRFAAGQFNWVVFTSQNAVRSFSEVLDSLAIAAPPGTRVAAIGPTTAAIARDAGFQVDLEPADANGRSLGRALATTLDGPARLLHVCGSLARPDFADVMLSSADVELTEFVAYETFPAIEHDPAVSGRFTRQEIDAITLMSPSAVEGLCAQAGETWAIACEVPAACVGDSTAAIAREMGLQRVLVATAQTASAVAESLEQYFRESGRTAVTSARETNG